mgnify:CR=1 FL=1
MDLCKRCLREFGPGQKLCPDCEIPLLTHRPGRTGDRTTLDQGEYVEVRRLTRRRPALAMYGHLMDAGIHSQWIDFDPVTLEDVYRVLVPERALAQAERALAALTAMQEAAKIEAIKRRDPRETLDMPDADLQEAVQRDADASVSRPQTKETLKMTVEDIERGIKEAER